MNSTSIALPPGLSRRVRAAAKRRQLTPEEFVVTAVEAELRSKPTGSKPSLFDQASDLCGSVVGGPADLARNPGHLKGYGTWKR
jgi:hypothetical protein